MTHARTIYVISDLHLGGDPGFRMMTQPNALADFIAAITSQHSPGECELVINGDFVDFLAQNHGSAGAPKWLPFVYDPQQARTSFEAIASGEDAPVFTALAKLLERGHRLTLLLGNHDIELCMPAVREALRSRLGATGRHDLQFIHDGEGYVIGDVLIEHGNRYDDYNLVDHERLHQFRVGQTLRRTEQAPFDPPLGSKFVATVMNPIKAKLGYIDLLKPEGPALVAVLLALAPEQRPAIRSLIGAWREHRKQHERATRAAQTAPPEVRFRGDKPKPAATTGSDDLADMLREVLGEDILDKAQTPTTPANKLVMRGAVSDAWESIMGSGKSEVLQLLLSGGTKEIRRLELLRAAIRKIAPDEAEAIERSDYYAAAVALSEQFQLIVFGHTHGAMSVPIGPTKRYINTGTWANLMEFPAELRNPKTDPNVADKVFSEFTGALGRGDYQQYVQFRPHYAKIVIGPADQLVSADLCAWPTG